MSIKEYIRQEVELLDENGLEQLAAFLAGLKSRVRAKPPPLTPEMASLYKQFAQEEIEMAECGMNDYAQSLENEDK